MRGTRAAAVALGLALLVVLASIAGVLAAASPASAHATLVSSDPAEGSVLAQAPAAVRLTFDEAVRSTPDSIRVYGPDGRRIPVRTVGNDLHVSATLPDGLAEGSYVASWRVVSDDGHPETGTVSWSVGTPSAHPPVVGATSDGGAGAATLGLLQAALYVGLLLSVGLVWCLGSVLRPASGAPEGARRRLRALLLAVATFTCAAAIAWVPTVADHQAGPSATAAGAWSWRVHSAELTQTAMVVVGLAVAVALTVRRGGRRSATLASLSGLVAVAGPAVFGHTRSYGPAWLLITADVSHLGAGAAWFGGLVGLAVAWRHLAHDVRPVVVGRFSSVAASALGVLAATGALASWQIAGSWSALVETDWGRILLVKLGLVAVVAAIGGWNRRRLVPASPPALGRTIKIEALLIVGVLGLTAWLSDANPVEPTSPPAGSQASSPATTTRTVMVGSHRVRLTLTPARVGRNTIRLAVSDPGRDVPSLYLAGPRLNLGQVPVTEISAGRFRAVVLLPDAGAWRVRVRIGQSTGTRTLLLGS